jgi:hypothetical protein
VLRAKPESRVNLLAGTEATPLMPQTEGPEEMTTLKIGEERRASKLDRPTLK